MTPYPRLLVALILIPALVQAQSGTDRARAAAAAAHATAGESDTLLRSTITPGLSGQPIATIDGSTSFMHAE